MTNERLNNVIALVTGASRGVGKGIAHVLVKEGATVYITGRKHNSVSQQYPDVFSTAEQLNTMNRGTCIPFYCDHTDDSQTKLVFDAINQKESRLDILVNCAFGGLDMKKQYSNTQYWEEDFEKLWKTTIDAGLRSAFINSCMAIKLMLERGNGLIINISSIGSVTSLWNPIYCLGKEGTDRLSSEMAFSLKKYNINVISLWPGLVRTEAMIELNEKSPKFLEKHWPMTDSIYLPGKAIVELYLDKLVHKKSGKIQIVADLAHQYGFTDEDGQYPTSSFSLRYYIGMWYPSLIHYIPHFIQIPGIFLAYYTLKF